MYISSCIANLAMNDAKAFIPENTAWQAAGCCMGGKNSPRRQGHRASQRAAQGHLLARPAALAQMACSALKHLQMRAHPTFPAPTKVVKITDSKMNRQPVSGPYQRMFPNDCVYDQRYTLHSSRAPEVPSLCNVLKLHLARLSDGQAAKAAVASNERHPCRRFIPQQHENCRQ